MKVRGMWRPVARATCGVAALFALAGSAQGQEAAEGSPARAGRAAVESADAQESSSGSGSLSRFFTDGRLQVHVNGAYQAGARRDELDVSFPAYGERAQFAVRENVWGAGHVDLGGTLRVWGGLLFGGSFTQANRAGSATVTGTVPHPLDVGRDRTTPERTLDLVHRERATHVHFGWRLALRDRLHVDVLAGPTYFNLRRAVVVHLTPVETGGPPFDTVGLEVAAGEHTRNGAGYHAGIDITWMLTSADWIPQVGVGVMARFTGGSVSVPGAGTPRGISVGGVQVGGGLRFRF